MAAILRPRTVALDTSGVSRLASKVAKGSASAVEIRDKLHRHEWVLTLSAHHMQELLAHGDDTVVSRRVSFLRSLPMLAWIRPVNSTDADPVFFGTVFDVFALEVNYLLDNPNTLLQDVVAAIRPSMLQFGDAHRSIDPALWSHARLLHSALESNEEKRELSSFLHAWSSLRLDVTVGELKNMPLSDDPHTIARNLRKLEAALEAGMIKRMDPNLRDHRSVVFDFIRALHRDSRAIPDSASRSLFDAMLRHWGLETCDFDDSTPWQEVANRWLFRRQVDSIIKPKLNRVFDSKSLPPRSVPSRASPDTQPVDRPENRC